MVFILTFVYTVIQFKSYERKYEIPPRTMAFWCQSFIAPRVFASAALIFIDTDRLTCVRISRCFEDVNCDMK